MAVRQHRTRRQRDAVALGVQQTPDLRQVAPALRHVFDTRRFAQERVESFLILMIIIIIYKTGHIKNHGMKYITKI